jgi:hypothetical protein
MKALRMQSVLLAAGLLGVGGQTQAGAADPAFDYVLTGFQDSRQRLKTGVCSVQGRKIDIDPVYGRLEGEVRLFVAFDYDAGLLRFDRTEPIRVGPDGNRDPLPKAGWVVGSEVGKYVKTPSRTLMWINDNPRTATKGALVVHGPGLRAYKQASPFDIRVVGAGNYLVYTKNGQLDALVAGLRSREGEAQVERPAPDRARLVFRSTVSEIRIEFDESRQFVPTRCVATDRRPDGKLADRPSFESSTDWVKQVGVELPARLQLRYAASPQQELSYDLNFEWQRVNEPLPAELFQPQGMELPDGLAILRPQGGRVGGTVSLGRVGDLTPDPRLAAEVPEPSDPRPWVRRNWYWVVGAVTLAVLTVYALIGRLRRGPDE